MTFSSLIFLWRGSHASDKTWHKNMLKTYRQIDRVRFGFGAFTDRPRKCYNLNLIIDSCVKFNVAQVCMINECFGFYK